MRTASISPQFPVLRDAGKEWFYMRETQGGRCVLESAVAGRKEEKGLGNSWELIEAWEGWGGGAVMGLGH